MTVDSVAAELTPAQLLALEMLARRERVTGQHTDEERVAGTTARALVVRRLARVVGGGYRCRRVVAITDLGREARARASDLRISSTAYSRRPLRWSKTTTSAPRETDLGETEGEDGSSSSKTYSPVLSIISKETFFGFASIDRAGTTPCPPSEERQGITDINKSIHHLPDQLRAKRREAGRMGGKKSGEARRGSPQLDLFGAPASPPRRKPMRLDQLWIDIVGVQPGNLSELYQRLRGLAEVRHEPIEELAPAMLKTFRKVMEARERRYRSFGVHALLASGTWEEVQLVMDGRQPLYDAITERREREGGRGQLRVARITGGTPDEDEG